MRGAADCAGAHSAQRWMFPSELNRRWLHDLRHFYASALIVAGCDVVTVQRALDHHSAVVTLSTYGHLWPTAEDRTRAAAAALMASATSADAPVRPQRARGDV
jgi:integrase